MTSSIVILNINEEEKIDKLNKNVINKMIGIEGRIKEDTGYIIINNKEDYYLLFITELPSNIIKMIDVHKYNKINKNKINKNNNILERININRIINIDLIEEETKININDMIYDIVNKMVMIKINIGKEDIKSIKIKENKENKEIMKFRNNTKIRYNAKDSKLEDIELRSEIMNIEIIDYNEILGETIYYEYNNKNKYNNMKLKNEENYNIRGMPVYDVEDKFVGVIYDEKRIIPSNIIMNNINKINKINKNLTIKGEERNNKIKINNIELKIKTLLNFGLELEEIKNMEKINIKEMGNIDELKYIDKENIELNEEIYNIIERNKK